MPPIGPSTRAIRTLQTKLDKVASLSGDNKKLANQELKIALEKGLITKPQRDLLARAISDS
ncbi:MAG: hypothetical protein JNG84_00275, partial [Archangium sp.]|nr:hypothetical protein [Archangium sp.]